MRGPPVVEADGVRRHQRESCSRALTDDGPALHLRPQRMTLTVVHDEIALVELPRRAEVECGSVDDPLVDETGVAERAVRDHHRLAADGVIDDLVPHQDLQGYAR